MLGLQLRPRLQNANCLSQENVKSITFTFVSQFGANFEIKFLILLVNTNIVLEKKSVFLKIRHLENRFFPLPTGNTCIMGLRSPYHYRALGQVVA